MEEGPLRGNPLLEWQDYMAARRYGAEQAKLDVIHKSGLGNEYRVRSLVNAYGEMVNYVPKTPPAFFDGVYTNYDVNTPPLASVQDPNYWQQHALQHSQRADQYNWMFKKLSEPKSGALNTSQDALESLAKEWKTRNNLATNSKIRQEIAQEAYSRQVYIQDMRSGKVTPRYGEPVSQTAELAEQAARDYEFASPKNKYKASINLNKYLGDWNEMAHRQLIGINKGGYLLSNAAGNIGMIADAGRLMGGGGIGVSPDGLPMIQSKSEMQQDAGIPEELRGSFRISTDEEMASYRKDLAKQDAENKRLEEVGKVLLAKQERKKMNNAIDAGAEMMGKLSTNENWSKILGF